MATFCTKCGLALSPDKNFCPTCGAAVTASDNPQAAAYQAPGNRPRDSNGSSRLGREAVKIILILVGVMAGLGLLMMMVFAFGAWRVSRAVHMSRAGNGVTFSTSGGTVTAGGTSTMSNDDLGVPAYPGAVREEGGMQIHTANRSMVTAAYTTADPSSQVLAYYKSKLGENIAVMETGQGAIITSGDRDKDGVMITVTASPSSTGGKTKIVIVHSKNSQP